MPASSSPSPQFLHLPRSRSRSRSPLVDPPNDLPVSANSIRLHVSRASSSSHPGFPEQDMPADTGTSHPSALGNTTGFQHFARRPPIYRAPDAPDGQYSWPVNQIDFIASPSRHIPSPYVLPSQLQRPRTPNLTSSTHTRQSVIRRYSPYQHETSSQRSSRLMQPSGQNERQPQHHNPGMFYQAHDFTVTGTFIENYAADNIHTTNQFMEKLLDKTIQGAASDSSARDPPPRCHPGTRLAILERCLQFIANTSGEKNMRWVVGAAGVGKSAIMQSVTESPELPASLHASVFFSINGRNDGTKAIITISYQLAAKSEPYRQVVEYKIGHDPSLLQSSMRVQFTKLIIEPFIHDPNLNAVGRVLIIIDGLDECHDPRTQQELLRLITDFCTKYPSSPIAWLVASRPETHITSFLSRAEVASVYEKEEILVDSFEARADVERFLRTELTKIKTASGLPDPQWPKERDFWVIAGASGGLFAYAEAVTRYIGDSKIGSPALQLSDVLDVIDKHPMTHLSREEHPMALLDVLYTRILSNIPPKTMIYTRKLLLALASDWARALRGGLGATGSFVVLCNWLGMTPGEAHAAIHHLHSVLRVPSHDNAQKENIEPFHKSFIDCISDFSRSGFSRDIEHEARQLKIQCAFRILYEAPDGVCCRSEQRVFRYGRLTQNSDTGNKIALTWLVNNDMNQDDNGTRVEMYKLAVGEVEAGMERRDPTFLNLSCIRLLATRYEEYNIYSSPRYGIRDLLFDDSRRNEFMTYGLLKELPLHTVGVPELSRSVKLRFRRPATTVTDLLDPWNAPCKHMRKGEWEEGRDIERITHFSYALCEFCHERFRRHLSRWKAQCPDQAVPALLTSSGDCCVEVRFVDSEDGQSEWTYWFWFSLAREECEKYRGRV